MSYKMTPEDVAEHEKKMTGYREQGKVTTHLIAEPRKAIPQRPERRPNPWLDPLLDRIRLARIPEPSLEHRFHETRKWRFDLCWPPQMVALEVEGGIWVAGRHSRGAGMEADMEKYNEAQLLGWKVLRYSTEQAKHGFPISDLKMALS